MSELYIDDNLSKKGLNIILNFIIFYAVGGYGTSKTILKVKLC
jgi:hypothetical protein